VLFGITGDLARKKILPALYRLTERGDRTVPVIGVARSRWDNDRLRKHVIDKLSGKLAQRPELDAALAYLRPGDVLVVTKLDRLGRSIRNLIDLAALLEERGVGLRVLQQGIDTTTPAGRMMFHVLAQPR
jgi:DNA invertase Pin-like site-specific DNA recombinase